MSKNDILNENIFFKKIQIILNYTFDFQCPIFVFVFYLLFLTTWPGAMFIDMLLIRKKVAINKPRGTQRQERYFPVKYFAASGN